MKGLESSDKITGRRIWQLGEDPFFTNHFYTDNSSFAADGNSFIFWVRAPSPTQC